MTLGGVPVEDYAFYFFWGWFGGTVYEYVFLLKFLESERDLRHDLRLLRLDSLAESMERLKEAEKRLRNACDPGWDPGRRDT
jgi:hypothetical protein